MKYFYKITAIIMACLVLFSTSAFAVSMHYCGKTLVDYSFFKEAKSCGMERMEKAETQKPSACVENFQKESCCTDKKIVKAQDDVKPSVKTTFAQQVFTAAFFYTYYNLFEGLPQQIIPFKDYPPPLLIKDIQLLNENFLI